VNVHREMSDTDVLRAASKSLSALPVASPPDVQAIMARGRARRRHRLSAVAGLSATAAAGTALALGLTGILGSSAARSTGTIRTASFTLVSNANGTATLTINPRELVDAAALQKGLQQYGIRAMVTSGSFCSSSPPPAGFSQVVSFYPRPTPYRNVVPAGTHPTVTFSPSAMPTGTELSFGIFQLSSLEQQDDFVLMNSSSYTCTSTPPKAPQNGALFRVMQPRP
jgi:hypothetical protein